MAEEKKSSTIKSPFIDAVHQKNVTPASGKGPNPKPKSDSKKG